MIRNLIALTVAGTLLLAAPQPAQPPGGDRWQSLRFLIGTWEARTNGGAAKAAASGTYTFALELRNHVLARHSTNKGCKGPSDFDCLHGDLLYIYQDTPTTPVKAIYFDNEGHVIHYDVTTPAANIAVLTSDASTAGPQYRLTYELKGRVMSGKFQIRVPGQTEFKSYLEWSGGPTH